MMFSIIVPLYNVEKYAAKCIESVLYQNFENFELILINDGSTDYSGDICEQYAALDSRVKVIHKKNGGLSDARNAGLSIAKGEYVIFLDGDDYMVPESLGNVNLFFINTNKIDLVLCPLIQTYPNGHQILSNNYLPYKEKIISYEELISIMQETQFIPWGATKNIYRTEIIKKNRLIHKIGLIGAEDCDFFMNYMYFCDKIVFQEKPLAHYRLLREGSITTTMSFNALYGQLKTFQKYFKKYKKKENTVYTYFANKYANSISLLTMIDNEKERKYIIKSIYSNKDILKNTKGVEYSIAKIIWWIFGFYNGSNILKKIKRIKIIR